MAVAEADKRVTCTGCIGGLEKLKKGRWEPEMGMNITSGNVIPFDIAYSNPVQISGIPL